MSDWLSQIGGVSSALSGLDMAMPGDGDIPFLGEAYWVSEPVLFELMPSLLRVHLISFENYEKKRLTAHSRHTSSPLPS